MTTVERWRPHPMLNLTLPSVISQLSYGLRLTLPKIRSQIRQVDMQSHSVALYPLMILISFWYPDVDK